jgi:hypothetical protein
MEGRAGGGGGGYRQPSKADKGGIEWCALYTVVEQVDRDGPRAGSGLHLELRSNRGS